MAIAIIVPSLPTASVLLAQLVNNPGQSGGGSLSVARFTTGPDRPPAPNAGRKVRS